jgi:6-phosphofructokinase
MLKGNALIGQSGGPTSVINSSLAGCLEAALKAEAVNRVLGMNFGIEGFMEEKILDLSAQGEEIIKGLKETPGSALGSCRYKVKDEDFERILTLFKKYDIRYFFLIGGNDTMDTIHRVEEYCAEADWEMRGVGIPKTVDNDLFGTDHTPGFPSAGRYNALCVKEAGQLARDMKRVDQFVVYQTIGRDAGWLAAATALAREAEDDAPHLIYTPERKFKPEEFIEDARDCVKKYGWVSIVVSEGLCYEDGTPVSAAQSQDKFNNTEFGAMGGASVGLNVHRILREATGWRGEFQITESLPMSAVDRAASEDMKEAYLCGVKAVEGAMEGKSGVMVSMKRIGNTPYKIEYTYVPLSDVAVKAKSMPDSYINSRGNSVTEECLAYLKPLIGELPHFTRLKQVFVNKKE